MATRKRPRVKPARFRKVSSLCYILLASSLLSPALILTTLTGSTVGENISRLIIGCSGIGGLIFSVLSIALINGRSTELLSNTPISDRLALRHLLQGITPFLITMISVISILGASAHSELHLGSISAATSILALLASVILAFCVALLASLTINTIWIGLCSVVMIAMPLVLSWIPGGDTSLDSASYWMGNFLPSGWPIDAICREQLPEYFLVKCGISVALMAFAFYYLGSYLRMWHLPRSSWDDYDADLDDYLIETDQATAITTRTDLREQSAQKLNAIRNQKVPLPNLTNWMESTFCFVSGHRQKQLIQCIGIPTLTRSLYVSLLIFAFWFLIHRYFPADILGSGIIRAISMLGMLYGIITILPVSTLAGSLTRRINLNMQTVSPVCTLFPVKMTDVLRLHLTEWWIRALVSVPLVTAGLLLVYYDVHLTTAQSLAFRSFQATCLLTALPAATYSWTTFFGADSSNWRSSGKLHTLVILFLLALHSILIFIMMLMPQQTSAIWLLAFASALVLTSTSLILFSLYHYRSPKIESAYFTAE